MAENLAYAPSNGNYWAYDNNITNVETYGYLYDWETACEVCPQGWHLPSDAEWAQLIDSLGGEKVAGGKLKETGTTHWVSPNTGATNESGFTALPGGNREGNTFYTLRYYGCWWSDTEYDSDNAWSRVINFSYSNVFRYDYSKKAGLSVRCLQD